MGLLIVEFCRGANIGRLRQDRRRDRGGKQDRAGGVARHLRPLSALRPP